MGLCFKKELTLAEMVLFPEGGDSQPPPSRLQERLLKQVYTVVPRKMWEKDDLK